MSKRVHASTSQESLFQSQINQFKRREEQLKAEIEKLNKTVQHLIQEKTELELALRIHTLSEEKK